MYRVVVSVFWEGLRDIIGIIADWTGIIGFIMTIVLLIRSESLRKEIESQRGDYVKEQKNIKQNLISLRANIVEDGLLNTKIISDIRTQLFTFRQKYERLLNWEDRKRLKATLKLLGERESVIDRRKLCEQLDYFVARFERKEKQT